MSRPRFEPGPPAWEASTLEKSHPDSLLIAIRNYYIWARDSTILILAKHLWRVREFLQQSWDESQHHLITLSLKGGNLSGAEYQHGKLAENTEKKKQFFTILSVIYVYVQMKNRRI